MITEGYLARHYQGRKGGRAPALLDVAQDYALKIVADSGLFTMGLTFKGGTALRKYLVGTAGRFSIDLDFAAEEEGIGDLLFETLDGKELYDVRFSIEIDTPGRRGRLNYDLALFHTGQFNQDRVRELTYLKVFTDVTEDGLGTGPFEPNEDILRPRKASDFLPEDIGILAGEVNISLWLEKVHSRFDFLGNKSEEQKRWSQCNPKDAYEVRKVIQRFRA